MKQVKNHEPENATEFADGIKLQAHQIAVEGASYRIITVRTRTSVGIHVAFYHRQWHLKIDRASAWVLGHLFWGLSSEREPNTLLFLGEEFLEDSPGGRKSSGPLLITMPALTSLDPRRFAILRQVFERHVRTHRGKTIHWRTHDLQEELLSLRLFQMPSREWIPGMDPSLRIADKMTEYNGTVYYSVSGPLLRDIARFLVKGSDIRQLGLCIELKVSRRDHGVFRDSHQRAFVDRMFRREYLSSCNDPVEEDEEQRDMSVAQSRISNTERVKTDRRR